MRKLLLVCIFIFSGYISFSQEQEVPFSEAIATNLPKYKEKADEAYRTQNMERADFLFDSLVKHCLRGSYLDNFKVHNLKKKEVYLEDFEKPVFLRTYASWLVPSEGEVPALNALAKEYKGEVEIVVLFWDDHATTKALAEKYEKNIKVLYVDELKNKSPGVIRTMKHSLGFPTTFLLDSDKRIVDIRRSISLPFGMDSEKSFSLNYTSIEDGISLLLMNAANRYSEEGEYATLP